MHHLTIPDLSRGIISLLPIGALARRYLQKAHGKCKLLKRIIPSAGIRRGTLMPVKKTMLNNAARWLRAGEKRNRLMM